MEYTYTDAKEYCNRQKIDEKSSEVGVHPSQLWKYTETTRKLINKEGIWTSPKDVKWNFEKKKPELAGKGQNDGFLFMSIKRFCD